MSSQSGRSSNFGNSSFVDALKTSEIQAPLLGIIANARVAKTKLGRRSKVIEDYLAAIEFSSQKLVQTIDVLFQASNVSQNSLSLTTQPLHVDLYIEQAIAKLKPLCMAQAQIFDFKPRRGTLISANRELLELVLYHAMENALHSSGAEEIISIQLHRNGDMARIKLITKGGFQKAVAIRKSIKNTLSGASIGHNFSLAASVKLLRAMGGSFNATQRKDGVSFVIDLPISLQSSLAI